MLFAYLRGMRTRFLLLLCGIALPLQAELFVTGAGGTSVRSYDPFTGALRKANFTPGTLDTSGCLVAGPYLFVSEASRIQRFNAATGATAGGVLITGLSSGHQMAVSGSDLFVANFGSGVIGKYTTSGTTVNASFITGLSGPFFLAISGTDLYVSNYSGNSIGRYKVVDGSVVNASFITGLSSPAGLVIDNGVLYVVNSGSGGVATYDAETGALIDGSFITGLSTPFPLVLYKGRLYVGDFSSDDVGAYDAATGDAIDTTFISGIDGCYGLAARTPGTPTVRVSGPKVVRKAKPKHPLKGTGTEIDRVQVKIGGSGYKNATITSTGWSYRAKLKPGRNRVLVQGTNSEGVKSAIARVTLIR